MTTQVNNTSGATPTEQSSIPQEYYNPPSIAAANLGLQLIFSLLGVAENNSKNQMVKEYEEQGLKEAHKTFRRQLYAGVGSFAGAAGDIGGAMASFKITRDGEKITKEIGDLKGELTNIGQYKDAISEKISAIDVDDVEDLSLEPNRTLPVENRIGSLNDSDQQLDAKDLNLTKDRDGVTDAQVIQDMKTTEAQDLQGKLNTLEEDKNKQLADLKAKKDQAVSAKAQAAQHIGSGLGQGLGSAFTILSGHAEAQGQIAGMSKDLDDKTGQSLSSAANQDAQTVQELQQLLAQEVKAKSS